MSKHHHLHRLQHLLALQMALAVTLASGTILAASVGETPAEEPAPPETVSDPAMDARREKMEDFKSDYLLSRKVIENAFTREENLRTKRAELRAECREDIRKANRDQRFHRISGCMQEDLSLTLEMIAARGTGIAAIAGVSSDLKKLIIARNELLQDAVETIVMAIDAGVYSDEEGLLEAKDNLREKYVKPYTSLLPKMHAEHALSWVSHPLVRSDALKKTGTLSEQVLTTITEAEKCLLSEEAFLNQAIDGGEIHVYAGQSTTRLPGCLDLLTEAQTLWNQEQTRNQQASSVPQWENRKLRRLPQQRN